MGGGEAHRPLDCKFFVEVVPAGGFTGLLGSDGSGAFGWVVPGAPAGLPGLLGSVGPAGFGWLVPGAPGLAAGTGLGWIGPGAAGLTGFEAPSNVKPISTLIP